MPHREKGPWDPGLQLERTTLAWLRTTLAFAGGGLVLIRLMTHASLLLAAACVVVGLPLSILIAWLALKRHRQAVNQLHTDAPLPGGALPAAVTAMAILVGCAGIAYVLTV